MASSVNEKRYAASAIAIQEMNKIYLFGGRQDQNTMNKTIEEYDAVRDKWEVVNIKWPHQWTPVEVCTGIQISPFKLIIFGGTDINVEDS